jgi:uncharacterized LabA/DUF88 family protein
MDRTILFIDGENLVFRYQDAVKAGRVPNEGVVHEPDCFVWHPSLTSISVLHLIRVCYYTSVVGDDPKVEQVKQKLASIMYQCDSTPEMSKTGQIVPMVFKKLQKSTKTRVVDIHLIIDVLRFAHSNAVDLIYLASGDLDYMPLIQEVMRQGKQVYVGGFSSGLAKPLTYSCDEFFDLDQFFFQPLEVSTQPIIGTSNAG